MGGYASGRIGWRAKCESLLSIDVRRWVREGQLNGPKHFGWRWVRDGASVERIGVWVYEGCVELEYRKDDDQYRYQVNLDSTPCHFGGRRRWFRCPTSGCGRRVALLYLGNRYFACRRCYRLAYQSQCQMPWERAIRAADRITARLNQDAAGNLTRRKRMRWATYEHLVAQLYHYDNVALDGIRARVLGPIDRRQMSN